MEFKNEIALVKDTMGACVVEGRLPSCALLNEGDGKTEFVWAFSEPQATVHSL